jgi:single-strand DNA-binding protein
MANLNKVMLMGNLTRDPELRYTPSGTAVTDFGMAINRKYKDQDETTFVDCVAWARTAEVISEYLKKGRPIFVEGRLTFESWEGRDGQKRNKLKVTVESFQFIGGREGGGDGGNGGGSRGNTSGRGNAGGRPQGGQAPAPQEAPQDRYEVDDDIPF